MGGLGPTSRQFGTALDHVVEVEVVLANGTIARANEQLNPSLFWAIKGAGASFGIVTEFVVRTEPEPAHVVEYSYNIVFGGPRSAASHFKAWQKAISDPNLDRRLATIVTVTELAMVISGTFFGTEAEFTATGFAKALGDAGKITVFDDWLGTVGSWAEREFLSAVGGIVSRCSSLPVNEFADLAILHRSLPRSIASPSTSATILSCRTQPSTRSSHTLTIQTKVLW